ncbi:hypothetical protein [Streptomyces varsoviensis]|uniref:Lipoprotein n=1 Tax=Streptomyces varsoviensis TaxID=67373 RepID=A0ABR5IT88_9ACTN|nr:hypothetical protein [Streptomyces varsoviensis]KOG59481.1 hypothetical protein ADK38_42625 [Streptomyces varsoviensis]
MTRTSTGIRAVGMLTAAGLLLVGCGAGGKSTPERPKKEQPTMDMQEAGERAEVILDDTFQGIKPPVKWVYFTPNEIACSDSLNLPTGTTTVKRSRGVTTKISAERRGSFLGVVQRHWEQQGYRIVQVDTNKDMPGIEARTKDGFTVSLGVGDIGNVYFNVASPCAKDSDLTFPKGTPGKPGGPTGKVDLNPRDESDFWSSKAPLKSS